MKYILSILLILTPVVACASWGVMSVKSAAVSASSVFLSDSFTETSDTALESHTPETGGSWSGVETTNFDVVSSTNEVSCDSADALTAVNQATPGSANYYVEISAKTVSETSSYRIGVKCRQLDDSNFYYFFVQGDGTTKLYEKSSDSWGTPETDSVSSFSGSTYYDVRIECDTTEIRGYVDNVLKGTLTDSTISAANKAAISIAGTTTRIASVEADEL